MRIYHLVCETENVNDSNIDSYLAELSFADLSTYFKLGQRQHLAQQRGVVF